MADHTANTVTTYLLEIPAAHKELLGHIRHWDNLKAAFETDALWIKDITPQQAESVLIKGLPYSKLYYSKDGLLFFKDSLLPVKKQPQSLLWSPIGYALPVQLPSLNHNYFGISQKIEIKLQPSEKEQPVTAVFADKDVAGEYIQSAPKIRLAKLNWVGVNNSLLIYGTPVLPVYGKSYWQFNDFLLPAGFEFELPLLASKLQHKLDPDKRYFILWQEDNSYIMIPKKSFMPLTISSYRLTYTSL